MGVYSIEGVVPVVHPEAFVHPDAVLIGDVHVGAGAYVGRWPACEATSAASSSAPAPTCRTRA